MVETKNIFNVNDTDESLKSKLSGKFGMNHGHITKFEFSDTAGKNNTPGNAVVIVVQINDKEYRLLVYELTGALFGPNNTTVEPENKEKYEPLFYEQMGQRIAVIKHALKAVGVTQEQIDNVSKNLNPNDIPSGMKALVNLVPPNYKDKELDIFLQYQWDIKSDQDRTYLELSKNMKGGPFIIPKQNPVGSWKEVLDEKGLRYEDDAGNVHPFVRNTFFMESPKAIRQGVDIMPSTDNKGTESTWA